MKPEHGGLDDKTVEMFGEFMKLVKTENETARQAMDDMDLDEDFKCLSHAGISFAKLA